MSNDLGVEIDLGPLVAELRIGLDGVSSRLDRMDRMQQAARRSLTPTDIPIMGQVIVGAAPSPSTTRAAINLGSPDQGHVWLLRHLSIVRGDVDLPTALGGTAWVFVLGTNPLLNATILNGQGLVTSFASLPATSTWTSRQIMVKAEEYLWVVITGGTQNQQAFAYGRVEDYQEHASSGSFEL
jgi:hypothetical protein